MTVADILSCRKKLCSVTHSWRHQSICIVEYFFLFPMVQKVKKLPRNTGVIVKNSDTFYSPCCTTHTSATTFSVCFVRVAPVWLGSPVPQKRTFRDNYFACGSGGDVLWSVRLCVCVCLSVCEHLPNHTRDLCRMFCACCLSPWLGPSPVKGKG